VSELHLIKWEHVKGVGEREPFYRLTFGRPQQSVEETGLVDKDGLSIARTVITGYDNVQDVVFAFADNRWKKGGRRMKQDDVKAAQVKIVEEAWGVPIVELEESEV
jgi:hypothetical protein